MTTDCPLCCLIQRRYLSYIGYEIEWKDIALSNSFGDPNRRNPLRGVCTVQEIETV